MRSEVRYKCQPFKDTTFSPHFPSIINVQLFRPAEACIGLPGNLSFISSQASRNNLQSQVKLIDSTLFNKPLSLNVMAGYTETHTQGKQPTSTCKFKAVMTLNSLLLMCCASSSTQWHDNVSCHVLYV